MASPSNAINPSIHKAAAARYHGDAVSINSLNLWNEKVFDCDTTAYTVPAAMSRNSRDHRSLFLLFNVF